MKEKTLQLYYRDTTITEQFCYRSSGKNEHYRNFIGTLMEPKE